MANGAICSVTTPDIPTTSYILDGLSDDGDGLPDDVNEKNEAEPGGTGVTQRQRRWAVLAPGFVLVTVELLSSVPPPGTGSPLLQLI